MVVVFAVGSSSAASGRGCKPGQGIEEEGEEG